MARCVRVRQGERRNFLFRTPLFGGRQEPRPEADWKDSPYYLWWEYLRRHEGYARCCKQDGRGKYAKLYADFGNIHNVPFRDWWQARGGLLFGEPPEMPFHEAENIEELQALDRERVGVVIVPLHMRKGYLRAAFNSFLDKRHKSEVVKKRRVSKAKYPIAGRTPVLKALKKTLEVHDARRAMPEAFLWEIAEATEIGTRLSKGADLLSLPDIRRSQTVQVVRYLKHAKAYIENVALGRFPVKEAPRREG